MWDEPDAVSILFSETLSERPDCANASTRPINNVKTFCSGDCDLRQLVQLWEFPSKTQSYFDDRLASLEVDFADDSTGTVSENFVLTDNLPNERYS